MGLFSLIKNIIIYKMDKYEENKNYHQTKSHPLEETKVSQIQTGKMIGKGTFGVVYLAYLKNKQEVALKRVQVNPKYKNRQIQILSELHHPNIVQLINHFQTREGQKNYTNIVMEYLPCTIIQVIKEGGIKNRKVDIQKIICYIKGMLEALAYLDNGGICHRDIKPSNILVDPETKDVKLCDFGSAKKLKKGEKSIVYICSRYYRAPELIFECTQYSTKIDMWSIGCVIAELLIGKPIFDGTNSMDQLVKIIKVLGAPTKSEVTGMKVPQKNKQNLVEAQGIGLSAKIKKHLVNCPDQIIDFLRKILTYNPEKRLSAKQALQSQIFKMK